MGKLTKYPEIILLFVGLLFVALLIRANATTVIPIAESARFAFQLMVAGTALAVLRNEAGLSTFGVFGPVILAFAWIEVGPVWGFLLISYIFTITTSARFALGGLDLGTSHRVATLLILAGIGVFTLQVVGQLQGVPPFTTLLLFPVILTAWYSERFVQTIGETGWAPAARRLSFTVLGIAVAFLVAGYEPLITGVINTPESWVGLVAVNVVLGAGTDVRLGEYFRFKVLRRALGPGKGTDVLTMRVRNRDYISRYNPSSLMGIFNKERMKELLHGLGIPTPKTHMVVESSDDFHELRGLLDREERLVIKPIDGMGGRDVLVVRGRDGTRERFVTNRGTLSTDEVVAHARKICVGGVANYGARSRALVESVVTPDGLLADRVRSGVPDIRIIMLHGFPIMAMARLPTEESNGTANIHTGAVAVAVGISSGDASGGYQQTRDEFLDDHPDTGEPLTFTVPEWESVLNTASRAAIASGFGYTGVDIVFDRDRGPMVLEVNRRPGLGIQNANMAGLLGRLRFVEAKGANGRFETADSRVSRAMDWDRNGWQSGGTADQAPIEQELEVSA